jgi:hypothetical protein
MNGNTPQWCGTCGAPMVAIRPGKARCQRCDETDFIKAQLATHADERRKWHDLAAEYARQIDATRTALCQAQDKIQSLRDQLASEASLREAAEQQLAESQAPARGLSKEDIRVIADVRRETKMGWRFRRKEADQLLAIIDRLVRQRVLPWRTGIVPKNSRAFWVKRDGVNGVWDFTHDYDMQDTRWVLVPDLLATLPEEE